MEILSDPAFWSALFAIILIDLALAGDNALVIGLAVRNIPANLQARAIAWGTALAIIVRCALTLVVVWLLKVPGFMLGGGLLLAWIAYRLAWDDGSERSVSGKDSLRGAIGTIVVADTVMGLENVLAVGGAANGSFLLVVLGLLISVPIIVFGAKFVLKAVERYPKLIVIGAGVLAWTAAKMIVSEPFLKPHLAGPSHHWLRYGLYALLISVVVIPPLWVKTVPNTRLRVAQGVVLLVWLAAFDWLETYLDWDMHPVETWRVWHEGLDLVMFVGWIPVVIALEQLSSRRKLT